MSQQPTDRKGRITSSSPTPADRLMAELDGVYYRLTEVAKIIGVHENTLRRLITKETTKAPSKILTRGGMRMYLYTQEDVDELREYYNQVKETSEE